MRTLLHLLTNPILFGVAGVGLFVLSRFVYPRYETAAGALFLVWAIAVGLNYAFSGEDGSNRNARL